MYQYVFPYNNYMHLQQVYLSLIHSSFTTGDFHKAPPAAINCVQVASRVQPQVIRWPGESDCTPIGINTSSIVA